MSLSLASRLCCGVFRLVKGAVLALPVVLVVGLVAVDWYVFVVQWAIGQQHNNTTGVYALAFLFSCVVVMVLWSYARTILTSSSVRDNPPPEDYFHKIRQMFPGQPERTCPKCDGAPKPLRTHHCSICGTCILKMDHHCPWVATCVGFKNYKFFVLFVMWGCLGCTLYLIAGVQLITSLFTDAQVTDGFVSLLTSLLTAAFAISLLFFAGFHLHLILTGQSTIEASLNRRARQQQQQQQGANGAPGESAQEVAQRLTSGSSLNGVDPDLEAAQGVDGPGSSSSPPLPPVRSLHAPSSFSAGSKRANWDAVFGSDPWLWFLPINTLAETGYEFDFLLEDDEEEDSIRDLRDVQMQRRREEHERRLDSVVLAAHAHVPRHSERSHLSSSHVDRSSSSRDHPSEHDPLDAPEDEDTPEALSSSPPNHGHDHDRHHDRDSANHSLSSSNDSGSGHAYADGDSHSGSLNHNGRGVEDSEQISVSGIARELHD